jgi:hypothetical protein
MRNPWRVRTAVELAPGRSAFVEDMTSLEFEDFADQLDKVKSSDEGVGDVYARIAALKLYISEDGDERIFQDGGAARDALSYRQLDLVIQTATAQSVQDALAARFRGGEGEDAGVAPVPDGADVRVPSARSGNGDGRGGVA